MPRDRERDALLFEELVHRHADLIYHVARTWTRDLGEAEDLTQTAFIKAWRSFHRFDPATSFKAWILKILRNAAIDHLRAARGRPAAVSVENLDPGEEPAEHAPPPAALDIQNREIFYDVFGDEIARLLRRLPEEMQIAVLLCDVEGLRYREIAEVLDLPVGTVRSRIHRGRARLADLLRDYARRVGYLKEAKP